MDKFFTVTKIILLLSVVKFSVPCEETFSNTHVTLVGAKNVKTITGCFSPTEDLVKVTYIQIINGSVPILKKDAINSLPNLVDVILDNNNITDLQSGCFYNLTKLYLIKLRYNNFKTIREGVFNNLPITELCLTNNNIESIHPKAFNNIENLKLLSIDENKIGYWSGEWFKGSPKLAVLDFKVNHITSIPFRAFRNVKGVHYSRDLNLNISTNIFLHNNRIKYISDGAFDGIQAFGWLFLHRNELEEISEASLGTLQTIDWIRLEHNYLKCIPDKLVQISPKVLYYLTNNPLTDDCKNKFDALKSDGNSSNIFE
ncbi:leucine-rich repeat-containing G-protein coupled receptor 5-like [Cylas formicarius]|uniref:leucine-rich repeat-containing G-protein coupled receptor 5-like n=1 Tax=Cylas formicarius TaxID=197179 RepID=UPI0029589B21|nr:leucine-rich repeat-containing G-protein coupled receptor 5-like [Cylas formicarius]